jgi:hypothetical protein
MCAVGTVYAASRNLRYCHRNGCHGAGDGTPGKGMERRQMYSTYTVFVWRYCTFVDRQRDSAHHQLRIDAEAFQCLIPSHADNASAQHPVHTAQYRSILHTFFRFATITPVLRLPDTADGTTSLHQVVSSPLEVANQFPGQRFATRLI